MEVLRAVKAKYRREPSDYKSIEPPLSTLKEKKCEKQNRITGHKVLQFRNSAYLGMANCIAKCTVEEKEKEKCKRKEKKQMRDCKSIGIPSIAPAPIVHLSRCLPRKDIQHITISRPQHYISHIITVWRCVHCKASPLCTAVCGTR